MLGSDYRELIVPRCDNGLTKKAILIGGILLTAGSAVLAFFVGMMLLLLTLALGFGTWFLFTQNCIEYEYIISSDELEITKILAQSRRKPMLTVSLKQFTAFGALRDAEPLSQGCTQVLACSAQDDSAFYADFDHDSYGQTRLIWTPNDDILLYLTKHLPRTLGFRWEAQSQQNAE